MTNPKIFTQLIKKLASGEVILQTRSAHGQDFILLDKNTGQQIKIGQWEMQQASGCFLVQPLPYNQNWNKKNDRK